MTELDWLKTSTPATPVDPSALVQGSDAWRAWRGKGLGSSDAPVLLGWSPWKTVDELLREKRGTWAQKFGPKQQAAMDRGKELEPLIRAWYEREHGQGFKFPDATTEDGYRRASFDGLCREVPNPDGSVGRVLEIKAPNAKDHELARQGVVPEKYVPQVQWLLFLAKLTWACYVSFGTDGTYAVVWVKADLEMQIELARRAELFWIAVQAPSEAAGLELVSSLTPWIRPIYQVGIDLGGVDETAALLISPAGDVVEIVNLEAIGEIPTITEQETEQLAAETLKAQAEHVAAEARYEALKERLKAALGDRKKAYCGEAVLEWQEKKGNIDYAKVPELKGVDLEPYRKKPTKAFLFKRREGREP